MLGIRTSDRLTLYRRIGGQLIWWRTITGAERDLDAALAVAQELSLLALAAGGWTKTSSLCFDTHKPIQTALTRRLRLHKANGRLRILKHSGGTDSP